MIECQREGRVAEPTTIGSSSVASLVELTDEQLIEWIVEGRELAWGNDFLDPPVEPFGDVAADFWDQVSLLQANLVQAGRPRDESLHEAMAWLGVSASLGLPLENAGTNVVSPADIEQDRPWLDAMGVPRAEAELVAFASRVTERALRAVEVALSLRGSALRAATGNRG